VGSFERPPGWTDAERIPLVRIEDRHGNGLRYSYDTSDRVTEVRDDDDRFLRFHYGDCGLLERVEDHAGRAVRYLHDAEVEHLECVRYPPTSDHPNGIQRHYEYLSRSLPPELRHNIARVLGGDGRALVENEYDADPASWSYARVTRQFNGGHDWHYGYTQLQWVPQDGAFANVASVQVEVVAPDHGLTVYTFNYRGDLLDHRQRLVRDRSWRVVAWQYEYDSQGNRTVAQAPDGSRTLQVFDHTSANPLVRGTLLRRELTAAAGFPVPSRIVRRAEYEGRYGLVRREIAENGAVTRYRYDFDLAPDPSNTGKLVRIEYPVATLHDGTAQPGAVQFEYDARGQVTAVTGPTGIRHEIEYGTASNDLGRPVLRRLDAGGLGIEERMSYDAFGYLASMTDGAGATRQLVYNALGQIERRVSPPINGATAELVSHFDADGAVVALDRPRGDYADGVLVGPMIVDRFERNLLGHPTRLELAANTASPRITTVLPDFRGLQVRAMRPDGAEERRVIDERGLVVADELRGTDGTSTTTRRVYDRTGRLERLIDGVGRSTRYEYDGFGRLRQTHQPNGSTLTLSWDASDVLVEEQLEGDAGDGTTRLLSRKRYDYDERLRLVRTRESSFRDNPAAAVELVTRYHYDAADRIERIEDPRGGITAIAADGLGRPAAVTDPEGNIREYGYDGAGRLETTVFRDLEGGGTVVREWRTEHDARGRVVRLIDPNGTVIEQHYDDRDLPVRRVEPDGIERRRTFGAAGELLEDQLDPAGLAILNRWAYDPLNRPLRYDDPTGESTSYAYDGLGRLTQTTLPDGSVRSRTFSAAGTLASESLSGGPTVQFNYDAAGRVAGISAAAAGGLAAIQPHTFAYDGRDNVVSADAGGSAVERLFDSRGRLVRESAHGLTLETHYDDLAGTIERRWPDGRRERLETNLNLVGVRLERTAAGTLGDGPALIGTFTPAGDVYLGEAALAGGLSASADYDDARRITEVAFQAGGQELEAARYRYDERSRRRVEFLAGDPARACHHEFDARDRLVRSAHDFAIPALGPAQTQAQQLATIAQVEAAAAAAATVIDIAYDDSDARTTYAETGAAPVAYTYLPAHKPQTAGPDAFAYHPDGTRASDGARSFEVDALGRTVGVSDASGTLLRCEYDALGRPSRLREGNGQWRALSYLGDALLQESEAGAAMRQFSPHPLTRGALAAHVAGATYLTCFDARLNLVAAVNTSGAVVERYRYAPFGTPTVHAPNGSVRAASAIGLEPIFGGMRHMAAAGNLYLSRRRLMDPRHGIFVAPDPFGYGDSPSLYAYAAANPIDLVDPDGELAFVGILVVIGVGALLGAGLNAARQGIQIAEGSRQEFSWGELGLSAGLGAVLAPALVVAPELAVPLAAWGVAGGIEEAANGNYATATFDIVTSLAPFGLKGPRTATFGPGSRFGQMRGLGETASWQTRAGRFNEIDAATRALASDAWNRRLYRGTTYYEALDAESSGLLDLNRVMDRQRAATAPPRLGTGLYFTEALDPPAQGTATFWADVHGGSGTGGGPAVLEARIPRVAWWWLRRQPGVAERVPQPNFPNLPSTRETFVPEALSPWFNERATWRIVPDAPAPNASFSPMWPTLLTPPMRTPDDAGAAPPPDQQPARGNAGMGQGAGSDAGVGGVGTGSPGGSASSGLGPNTGPGGKR
jgi:RHS repeat-associated protein